MPRIEVQSIDPEGNQQPLEFGYAEAQITPDRNIALEGYEHRGAMGAGNAGVRDHLYVKALAVTTDKHRALFVSLDVCEFVPSLGQRFVTAVVNRTGVEPDNVLVAATHTHSGPVLDEVWGARDLPEDARDRHAGPLRLYVDNLVETVATTAAEACAALMPGGVSAAHHSAVLGYNRRKSGGSSADMLMSLWQHPDTRPDGPYDPDIPVILFERLHDTTLDDYMSPVGPDRVVIMNPAFHPVVLGQHSRLVSGDYPAAACRFIENHLGDRTRAMFFLGASGDTHPMVATQTNETAVEVMGAAVGAGVLAALAGRVSVAQRRPQMRHEPELRTGDRTRPVQTERAETQMSDRTRPVQTERAETHTSDRTRPPGTVSTGASMYVKNESVTVSEKAGTTVRLQIIAFGSVAFVGISAELFTEFGIHLKQNSPFPFTFVVTLAHGSVWYIPSREAFADGGYEIQIANDRGIDPGTLEKLEQRVLDHLAEAHAALRSVE